MNRQRGEISEDVISAVEAYEKTAAQARQDIRRAAAAVIRECCPWLAKMAMENITDFQHNTVADKSGLKQWMKFDYSHKGVKFEWFSTHGFFGPGYEVPRSFDFRAYSTQQRHQYPFLRPAGFISFFYNKDEVCITCPTKQIKISFIDDRSSGFDDGPNVRALRITRLDTGKNLLAIEESRHPELFKEIVEIFSKLCNVAKQKCTMADSPREKLAL